MIIFTTTVSRWTSGFELHHQNWNTLTFSDAKQTRTSNLSDFSSRSSSLPISLNNSLDSFNGGNKLGNIAWEHYPFENKKHGFDIENVIINLEHYYQLGNMLIRLEMSLLGNITNHYQLRNSLIIVIYNDQAVYKLIIKFPNQ